MAKCGGNEVTPKPPVVSTCPTMKGEYCVFPFKSGKLHNFLFTHCISVSGSTTHKKCAPYQGKHWCATSLKADGTYQEYDYCDMAKCGDIGKHKNYNTNIYISFIPPVTPTKPPVVSNCPTDAEKNCIFPFKDGLNSITIKYSRRYGPVRRSTCSSCGESFGQVIVCPAAKKNCLLCCFCPF